jgi:hypothetical protein
MTDEQRARLALYGPDTKSGKVHVLDTYEVVYEAGTIIAYGGYFGHDLQRLDQRRKGQS